MRNHDDAAFRSKSPRCQSCAHDSQDWRRSRHGPAQVRDAVGSRLERQRKYRSDIVFCGARRHPHPLSHALHAPRPHLRLLEPLDRRYHVGFILAIPYPLARRRQSLPGLIEMLAHVVVGVLGMYSRNSRNTYKKSLCTMNTIQNEARWGVNGLSEDRGTKSVPLPKIQL